MALLENVCDELGRNGVRKVLILSGHGGNRFMIPLLVQTLLEKPRPYAAYACVGLTVGPRGRAVLETDETGHACEYETSVALHIHPDLVKTDRIPDRPFTGLDRAAAVREAGGYSSMDWHLMYPTMYVGDARRATAEKGRIIQEERVAALAKLYRAIKADDVTPGVIEQHEAMARDPQPPY